MSSSHRDRARAESFGALAAEYDRLRPAPPAALIDDLVALEPSSVLDVGCGTGKVAAALAAHGLSVLGVEIDPRMAAFAPVEVEIAGFEDWDDRGRHFDLLTCGDAWHWIDPERGTVKAERVATHVVRFWSFHMLDDPAARAVYSRLEPELRMVGEPPEHPHAPDLLGAELRVYPWERELSREDWVALIATHSTHQSLGPARLAALQDGLRAVLPPILHVRGVTEGRFSSRAGPR